MSAPEIAEPSSDPFSFNTEPNLEGEPELTFARPGTKAHAADGPSKSGIDLSGKCKVWLISGPGSSGKTLFARWLFETAHEPVVLACLDTHNRSLADYYENVKQPETKDPADAVRFLQKLLRLLIAKPQHAIIDLGAGDSSLSELMRVMPRILEHMEAAGIASVAAYTLSTRPADLEHIADMEAVGFRPPATALIRNEGRTEDPKEKRETEFLRVMRHPVYKMVAERGMPIWMPRMGGSGVSRAIEGKRITFREAAEGRVPDGAKFEPLDLFDASYASTWLEEMEVRFQGVRTWRP